MILKWRFLLNKPGGRGNYLIKKTEKWISLSDSGRRVCKKKKLGSASAVKRIEKKLSGSVSRRKTRRAENAAVVRADWLAGGDP